ncbi:uncharacterized protein LOC144747707 [Ciona intestinalis]
MLHGNDATPRNKREMHFSQISHDFVTSQTLYINRDTHCSVDSSTRMLRSIICVLLLGNVAQGCHWFHRHRGKRSTSAQDTLHLRHYFANCLSSKVSGFDFASLVDYTILSSAWYANNQLAICSDSGDTAQCWADKLDQFIDRRSILSGPVRGCIGEYAQYIAYAQYNMHYDTQYIANSVVTSLTQVSS